MAFQTEFPDFPAADMPAIPAGFEDCSWHNDACPSFVSDQLGLSLFIDYASPLSRELPYSKRFTVMPQIGGVETNGPSLDTDDWNAVLYFIIDRTKTVIADVSLCRATGDLDALNGTIESLFEMRG